MISDSEIVIKDLQCPREYLELRIDHLAAWDVSLLMLRVEIVVDLRLCLVHLER